MWNALAFWYQIEEVGSGDSCESEEEGEGLEVDVEVAEGVADRATTVLGLTK